MTMRPLGRKSNIVIQELIDEILVYDLDRNKAVCLNETASNVWELCDGNRTISEITDEVGRIRNTVVAEELVWLAIYQLKSENLLSNGEDFATIFDGLTRREIIKKVGVTAMIALPIVSSIAAPNSAAAQSVGCVPISTCYIAGANFCAGCIGSTLMYTIYSSTDGNCTGSVATSTVVCVSATSSSNDVLITGIS